MTELTLIINGSSSLTMQVGSGVAAAQLATKVDKVDGKGLSTNDLTNDLKADYDKNIPLTGQTLTLGVISLSKSFTSYLNYQLTGALQLSIADNPIIGGFAEGVIIGDGTHIPTLSGIVEDPNSGGFIATNGIKNRFMCTKLQDAVYITYTQVL